MSVNMIQRRAWAGGVESAGSPLAFFRSRPPEASRALMT